MKIAALLLLSVVPIAAWAQSTPIQHVIIIMQENRSFDSYFGTFPGANGIPNGVCVPLDPSNPTGPCQAPFHDLRDVEGGGPHHADFAAADIDLDANGTPRMDGWVQQQIVNFCAHQSNGCQPSTNPKAVNPTTQQWDVMGYHTDQELPNYWAYARNFVLQDAMFESVRGWSGASHDYLTSEWSASCTNQLDASTCTSNPDTPTPTKTTVKPWVSLFELMDMHSVSWKYYLANGQEPDCNDGEMTCAPEPQTAGVPNFWNSTPLYAYVQGKGAAYLTQHNPPADQFLLDVKDGTLPAVSWVIPTLQYSEHPITGTTAGQDYVTSLVNAVMQSPYWQNTAIFLAWDDWGGFYDHVVPPNVDYNSTAYPVQGFGFRVPGLLISAYARRGVVDHQVLSFDSYTRLVEDLFMGGARIDPAAMGNPDARPDIRENLASVTMADGSVRPIGSLLNEFDFTQAPLPPLVLSTYIPSTMTLACTSTGKLSNSTQCKSTATLTLAWDAITGPNVPESFVYLVQRNGVTLPQCTGSARTCTDKPGLKGLLNYRALSIDQHGNVSPLSPAAQVTMQ